MCGSAADNGKRSRTDRRSTLVMFTTVDAMGMFDITPGTCLFDSDSNNCVLCQVDRVVLDKSNDQEFIEVFSPPDVQGGVPKFCFWF